MSLFFVAPLPPPVHGFALINEAMRDRLQQDAALTVIDVAPARVRLPGFVGTLLAFASRMLRSRPGTLYIALSGGGRQLVDLWFMLWARLAGARIFIHHHSFAYINRRPWYTRLLIGLAGPCRHIVLCAGMGEALAKGYGLDAANLRVLSNAAFLELPAPRDLSEDGGRPLRVGFLSAVSAEKGVFVFLDAIAAAAARGLAVEGLVAGPTASQDRARFEAALAATPQARHLGPLYGPEKQRFLEGLDLLLFPTLYVNEAEPVTLWEALGHGVPVVANARGCIAGMIPPEAGWVVARPDGFVDEAVQALKALKADPDRTRARRTAARVQFEQARADNQARLAALLAEITDGSATDAAPR